MRMRGVQRRWTRLRNPQGLSAQHLVGLPHTLFLHFDFNSVSSFHSG